MEFQSEGVTVTPAKEWVSPVAELDCGNSGTTMRLLLGMIASRRIEATLVGDKSLSRRPMSRVAEPLRLMGATVVGESPPLQVTGADLTGIYYTSPVASAQIKSCVLLAGLRGEGETWVREPAQSRDHTERMFRGVGIPVLGQAGSLEVGVLGGVEWDGFHLRVPGDISSAAFVLGAVAMLPGSDVLVRGVGVNPTRTGILDVLTQMGVHFDQLDEREDGGEPVADIRLIGPTNLLPFKIEGTLVPRLIDEIPLLAVLATQAVGVSTIRGAEELRVKESDRITRVAENLIAMGAQVETYPDGMDIYGPTPLRGASISTHMDHRMAMAFTIASMVAEGETVIDGDESIATSYPEFLDHLRSLEVV